MISRRKRLIMNESIYTRGAYVAWSSGTFGATGVNPQNQPRNKSAKVSFSAAVRTARKGWTVQRFHLNLLRFGHAFSDDVIGGERENSGVRQNF